MRIKKEGKHTEIFESHGINMRSLEDIQSKKTQWLMSGFLPRGALVVVAGKPGLGKTTGVLSFVAAETSGGCFPNSTDRGTRGRVLICSAEDDPASTIKPRLEAAGADMSRVMVVDSVSTERDGQEREASFLLSRDIDRLKIELARLGDVSMIVLDPLSAYLGARDAHRDADVREVLGPLSQLAADFNVCIVGVSHLNKNEAGSAMARVMGSTGIVGAARVVILAAEYQDAYVLVGMKNNLAPMGSANVYDIEQHVLDVYSPQIVTSAIRWLHQIEVTADEVLQQGREESKRPAVTEAEDFLHDQLRDGPRRAEDVTKAAGHAGIASRTLSRAKKNLGIVSDKDQFSGGWKWYTKEQHGAKDAKPLGTLRKAEKAESPETHIFGTLRNNEGLKPKQGKPLSEGCQLLKDLALFDAKSHPQAQDQPKDAKCTGLASLPESKREVLI